MKEDGEGMQLFRTRVSVYLFFISASLRGVFVLGAPASASVVRWNKTRVFVIGIRETVGVLAKGPPVRAISISKPSPFTSLIPSKAIVK